ncbi:endoplasmic reticulum lectin 1 isoform X2 [Thrips palmi]|uniref:Endoplasmic reticulum lectin 1 n=1 Tax=Thrips palmi TaxID=161013 RepID=A0A6P8Z6W2_THRPL|nr:endoplasmic reticulum lectin 1 isoform X2 [Thrips palmi]
MGSRTISIPIFAFFILLGGFAWCFDTRPFDDTILFKINWPGAGDIPELPGTESMLVTTENLEKYQCLLPEIHDKPKSEAELYTGPNPLHLLLPLFLQTACSYKPESYWTYEICHGLHVRQYHEEREGKKVKLQEYILGRWDSSMTRLLHEELQKTDENGEKVFFSKDLPTKKIDGLNLPYFQINMTDGTLCDLNDKPRITRVLYVCYHSGKHEVYSFKETSICEYEAIVLSQLLCEHPKYKPQTTSENIINCHALDSSPKKPRNLLQLEAESLKLRHTKAPDGEQHVHVEILPVEMLDTEDTVSPPLLNTRTPADTTPAQDFLSGKRCLTGGSSSWWKYEFCYGRHVEQYHIDAGSSSKTTVQLGFFNAERHIEWLKQNPHKQPKPVAIRKQISHFYSGGTPCDKTGRPRHTEVKLKCPDQSPSPGSVSLYLMEPRTCEYILTVESQLICDLLPLADEHGLIKVLKTEDDEVTVDDEDDVTPVEGESAVGPDDRTAAEQRRTMSNADPYPIGGRQ